MNFQPQAAIHGPPVQIHLLVTAPSVTVLPVVAATVPAVIGGCDSLTIDLSRSTWSGGRSWGSYYFDITPSVGEIRKFLLLCQSTNINSIDVTYAW